MVLYDKKLLKIKSVVSLISECMTNKYTDLLLLLFATTLIFTSCGSSKDVVYFQNVENIYNHTNDSSEYQIRIIPNDNLLITVSAINPQAAEVFNAVKFDRSMSSQSLEWQGYLVDQQGNINFPVIGSIHVGGLTKSEAVDLLRNKISRYIEDPVVNIRFLNYKITVLGEVNRPGVYSVSDEKITLPQALGLAGDMTIYGARKDVLICREVNGEKQFHRIDMTSPDVFQSPYYFLQQHDVVYVQPNNTKSGSSTYNQNLPLLVSLISVVITAIALFVR